MKHRSRSGLSPSTWGMLLYVLLPFCFVLLIVLIIATSHAPLR
jgi:hypothetical protein